MQPPNLRLEQQTSRFLATDPGGGGVGITLPTVPSLQADLNSTRRRALEEVLPALDEITLLGRYRMAKLGAVNSGRIFQSAMAVAMRRPYFQFELWRRILRHDPTLAVATPDEFAARVAELRDNPRLARNQADRLIPIIEAQLRERYPQHVQTVNAPSLRNLFGKEQIVNPDAIPQIQREVATRSGLQLPSNVPHRDLLGNEIAAERLFDEALEDVFAAQRKLVARVNDVLKDNGISAQLQQGLDRQNPVWTIPPDIYAAACRTEGSYGDVRDLSLGSLRDPDFGPHSNFGL